MSGGPTPAQRAAEAGAMANQAFEALSDGRRESAALWAQLAQANALAAIAQHLTAPKQAHSVTLGPGWGEGA